MTKLKVIGASLAMALLVASPAAADTGDNGNFGVQSEFLGTETVQFGGFSVESQFLFFDDGVFGDNDGLNNGGFNNGGFNNGFNNDFDEDDFDD